MTEIITVVADLVDDVFIRGIDLLQPFKPMTNNELAIEELKGIAGGLNPGNCTSSLTSKEGTVVDGMCPSWLSAYLTEVNFPAID